MKQVLVMGGSYFIGRKMVEGLLEAGYDVTVLNRGTRPIADTRVRQLSCDRNRPAQLCAALRGRAFDLVVDVCGVNRRQAGLLCRALDMSRLRHFVFLSSSAVYRVEELEIPFRETDALGKNVWGAYGTDKIEAEACLRQAFAQTNTRLTILRPPYVYGEHNYARRESFVFHHICNGVPVLIPKANPKLQFLYAGDLADILLTLLERDGAPGVSVYNVGNREPVTAREWVLACGVAAGKAPEIMEYDYLKDRRKARDFFPFFDYDNVLDVTKIKAVVPQETAFAVGLKNAYEWYLAEQDTICFDKAVEKTEARIRKKLMSVK